MSVHVSNLAVGQGPLGRISQDVVAQHWKGRCTKPTKYSFIEIIKSFTIKAVITLHVLEQSWTYDADNTNNMNNSNNKTNNSGTTLVKGLVQLSCQSVRADIWISRMLTSCSNAGRKTKVMCKWVEFEEIQTELNKTKKGKHKGEKLTH